MHTKDLQMPNFKKCQVELTFFLMVNGDSVKDTSEYEFW